MRRHALLLLAALAGLSTPPAGADNPAAADFEAFRNNALATYSAYRDDLMGNYARFLDQAWEEFESIKGEARNPKPKPVVPPAPPAVKPAPAKLPAPEVTPKPTPQPAAQPAAKPAAPAPAPAPVGDTMDYYGLKIDVPRPTVKLASRLADNTAFAEQWRSFLSGNAASDLAKRLGATAARLGLNDYLTLDFVSKYVDQKFPATHSSSRASLTHFVMATLGYDVRVALCGSDGVILVPTLQTVYGRPYMMMDGTKYYVFADNLAAGARISTCRLPADAATGRALDMHLNGKLNIPFEPQTFALEYGGISLEGEINKNLYPIIYRYPQSDMEVYATSVIDPELRANLVGQLKSQLSEMPRLDAVNALLQFTQNAIDYATDDAAHGFEKPYFLEEWLYYPKNDCEDRAVFYTYMLWNVLGVECQMITYPGHESAAVVVDEPIEGDNYTFGDKTFYISDPTYIGATTGQCMPDFTDTVPEIEYHYKK